MIAVAIVGLIGVGAAKLLSYVARSGAATRARTTMAADAQAVIERLIGIGAMARVYGGQARFCEAVVATGGPMAGGTATGSCPNFVVTDIPIPDSNLQRKVTLSTTTIGGAPALNVAVGVTSPSLSATVEVSAQIPGF